MPFVAIASRIAALPRREVSGSSNSGSSGLCTILAAKRSSISFKAGSVASALASSLSTDCSGVSDRPLSFNSISSSTGSIASSWAAWRSSKVLAAFAPSLANLLAARSCDRLVLLYFIDIIKLLNELLYNPFVWFWHVPALFRLFRQSQP